MSHFLSSWSRACLGKEVTLLPYHDRGFAKKYEQLALENPQQQQAASGNSIRSAATSISAKLFSFSEEAIHRLKQKAGPFSSFQVVCAHIWLNFCVASCLPESQKSRAVVAIDCRKRLVPEIAEGYFGNVVISTMVDSSVGELQAQGLPLAARIIAEGIRTFDMETIQKRLAKGGGIDLGGASIVVGGSHRSLVYEMDGCWLWKTCCSEEHTQLPAKRALLFRSYSEGSQKVRSHSFSRARGYGEVHVSDEPGILIVYGRCFVSFK